jgi:hypothetical protein
MHSLRPITRAGVPAALLKAERYRLLNDSSAAESICLDVLEVDPDNQQALVMLVLAITDQMRDGLVESVTRSREVLPRLKDEYKRHYYAGIICERRAKAQLGRGGPRAHHVAAQWLEEAMRHYEAAEAMRPAGNDEAILRWNTCARLLNQWEHVHPAADEPYEPSLE